MTTAAETALWNAPAPMRDEEFGLLQMLIHSESGIFLAEEKRELMVARLGRRLRSLGLASFSAYYRIAKQDLQERIRMLDCISTNETRFFREERQFRYIEERLIPRLQQEASERRRPRRIRVWSAGCSTGEEAYSLAMILLAGLPGWSVEILGTDISTRVLQHARVGVWPIAKANEIPDHFRKLFMLKGRGAQKDKMKVGPEISSVVRFERVNLHHEQLSVAGRFDLIFCRNVLIYFSPESRKRAMARLLGFLSADGLFFVGHSESLSTFPGVRSVLPTVYAFDGSQISASRSLTVSRDAS